MPDLSRPSAVIPATPFLWHFRPLLVISDQFSVARTVDLAPGTTAADALTQWPKVVRRRWLEFLAREIQNEGDIR